MRCAIRRRVGVSGMNSLFGGAALNGPGPPPSAGTGTMDAAGAAAGAAGVRVAAATMSAAVTRPCAPVPLIAATSIACSRARRRTAGETRAPLAEAPLRPLLTLAVLCGIGAAGATGATGGRAGSGCGGAATPASSMTAIGAPVGTVSPSATISSRIVPATGEGTSALTLSVETSTNDSYFSTVSPGCLSQRATVPSVTVSPSCGMRIVVLKIAPARASRRACVRSRS